ncbi:hypothetical protein AB0K02_32570 [Streptomyces sp. NPDC049597]|uniref:hypothetical protein n=1 Tax=Streptomyces sp. NPDC049597 TaxID=3155276 RepID=UPI0034219704
MTRYSRESRRLLAVTLVASTALFTLNPFLAVHLPKYAPGSGPIGVALLLSAVVGGVVALLASAAGGDSRGRLLLTARWSVAGLAAGAGTLAVLPSLPVAVQSVAVLAGLVLLRACLNLYSNASRSLHLLTNGSTVDTGVLFAAVGTFFGIGSAVGPVLGGMLLGLGGFGLALTAAALLFAGCLLPLARAGAASPPPREAPPPAGQVARLRPTSRAAARVCLGSGLAYVLYAQSLAYIPLTLSHRYPSADRLTVVFFTANAVLLIACSLPVMRAIRRLAPDHRWQSAAGVAALLAALLVLRCAPAGWTALAGSVVLYTFGEIVVPAVGMQLLKAETAGARTGTARNVAFFTFATNTVGMGAGQYVGTAVAALPSPAWHAGLWSLTAALSAAALCRRGRPPRTARHARPTRFSWRAKTSTTPLTWKEHDERIACGRGRHRRPTRRGPLRRGLQDPRTPAGLPGPAEGGAGRLPPGGSAQSGSPR